MTTTFDGPSSSCSLRGAISAANGDAAVSGCTAGSGADTIVLPAGTHKFQRPGRFEENNATGDLDIRSAVTIDGAGSGSIIEGSAGDRVIDVQSGAVVVLKNVVVTGGKLLDESGRAETISSNASQDATGLPGSPGEAGGGIRSFGNLTLDQAIVRDNVAGGGGTGGYATHQNGRSATGGNGGAGGNGGGIVNYGTLRLVDSRVTGNSAGSGGWGGGGTGGPATSPGARGGDGNGGAGAPGGSGGGIYSTAAVVLERSVIASNKAGLGGFGWIGNGGAGANNTSPNAGGSGGAGNGGSGGHGGHGGGLALDHTSGETSISDTTISGNSAGNGGLGQSATSGRGGNGGGMVVDPNGNLVVRCAGGGGAATGGNGSHGGSGGGVAALSGAMRVQRSTVASNTAGSGNGGGGATGGAHGEGACREAGVVAGRASGGAGGDGGSGGGIYSTGSGAKTVTDVTVDGNKTGSGAGGNGSVSGNPATGGGGGGAGSGGGLDGHGSPLAIVRATISANTLGTRALGAAGGAPGVTGSGGALWGGGTTRLTASIVAENQAPRCVGAVEDGGNNIDYPNDPDCPGTLTDPLLGPLADNGGPTQTRPLGPSSPAIDAFACNPGVDQRGVARPTGSKCDVGAYEFAAPVIANGTADADQTGVELEVRVTPNAGPSSVAFEYGTNESYGTTTGSQAISGLTPSDVNVVVDGLEPGTTYFWRTRVTTGNGTFTGPGRTFRTVDSEPPGNGGGDDDDPPPPGPVGPDGGGGTGNGGSGGGGGNPPVGPSNTPDTPLTPADLDDPILKSVKADPSRFVAGTKKTPTTARAARVNGVRAAGGKKPAVGTKLRFNLSEPAEVEIAIERKTIGKKGKTRSGKKTCERSSKPPADRSDRCTLYVEVGTLSREGIRGANSVAFTGRLGSRTLAVGAHRFIVSGSDTAGNDAEPASAGFTVLDPDD